MFNLNQSLGGIFKHLIEQKANYVHHCYQHFLCLHANKSKAMINSVSLKMSLIFFCL